MTEAQIAKLAFDEFQKHQNNAGLYIFILLVVLCFGIWVIWGAYQNKLKSDSLKTAAEVKTQENKEAAVYNISEFKHMFKDVFNEIEDRYIQRSREPEEMDNKNKTRDRIAKIEERQSGIVDKVDSVCEDMEDVRGSLRLVCKDISEIKDTIKTLKKE